MLGYVRFTYFGTRQESSLYVMAEVIETATNQIQYTYATFDVKPSDLDIEWRKVSEVHSISDVAEARDFLEHCTGMKLLEPCYK